MEMNYMNNSIRENAKAMESVAAVLAYAGIDTEGMDSDQMIDTSRKISAPCHHDYDRPYRGHETRVCKKCGGLQDN